MGPDAPELADTEIELGRALLEAGRGAEAVAPLEDALRRLARDPHPEGLLAQARFTLARALGRRAARAQTLARDARAGFVAADASDELAALDAWLGTR